MTNSASLATARNLVRHNFGRKALLATTALSGGFALLMANPQSALANCGSADGTLTNPGNVVCGSGTTTNDTAYAPNVNNLSREQGFLGPVYDS